MHRVRACRQHMNIANMALVALAMLIFMATYIGGTSVLDTLVMAQAQAQSSMHYDAAQDLQEHAGSLLKFFGWAICVLLGTGVGLIVYTYKESIKDMKEHNALLMQVTTTKYDEILKGMGYRMNEIAEKLAKNTGSINTIESILRNEFLSKHEHDLLCDRVKKKSDLESGG